MLHVRVHDSQQGLVVASGELLHDVPPVVRDSHQLAALAAARRHVLTREGHVVLVQIVEHIK